jgi:hypothetical protein
MGAHEPKRLPTQRSKQQPANWIVGAGVGVNVVLGHGCLPRPQFFARNTVGFYKRILRGYPAGVFGFKSFFSLG